MVAPAYQYPVILWDLLPKAGASQVHPHIHTTLSRNGFYGNLGFWQQRTAGYNPVWKKQNDLSSLGAYFEDMLHIQTALGLAVKYMDNDNNIAWALPSLVSLF